MIMKKIIEFVKPSTLSRPMNVEWNDGRKFLVSSFVAIVEIFSIQQRASGKLFIKISHITLKLRVLIARKISPLQKNEPASIEQVCGMIRSLLC